MLKTIINNLLNSFCTIKLAIVFILGYE